MLENNNLYLGDCLDIMDNITDSSIDLIITDVILRIRYIYNLDD